MNYHYATTVCAAAVLMLFSGTSRAGTWVCSDPQGNEVYTDRNGPGCREFQPTNPDDIPKKPSATPPQTRKRTKPAPIPQPFSLRPFTERQSDGTAAEGDHKGSSYSEYDVLRAVASGNKAKLEVMLRGGISANAKDEHGQSALTMGAALPSTDIAEVLMRHGADVNARSIDGATPLMAAIVTGHPETAKLLLRNGADVNAAVPMGSPAPQLMPMLFIAIAIGDGEIAKLLIEEGANVNVTLKDGEQMFSPLAFARRSGQRDIAQLLIAKGAKENPDNTVATETRGPLEEHIKQLEGRLASLCKDAGEKIYEVADNVEGIYIHLRNPDKAFGYYHEKDRLSLPYLTPRSGKNYRFWEMDASGKDGGINHQQIEAYPAGKTGEQMIELKQVALPAAVYGITWRPLTAAEDQRQGLYGDELKIFNVKTQRILAVRTLYFYAITETTVDASGKTLPIPGRPKLYRFATCPNYNPGPDDSYPDQRPRDSYRFVSKVLRPSTDTLPPSTRE